MSIRDSVIGPPRFLAGVRLAPALPRFERKTKMCRNIRRSLASFLLVPATVLCLTAPVQAKSFWDWLTHKDDKASSGSCNSPTGKCGTPPAAGAVPGSTQPYMVPIGPPRYVPAAPGTQMGAPSLSPSGVSIPSNEPNTVSRPIWPSTSAMQNPYPFTNPATISTPQTLFYQPSTTVPSTVPAPVSPVPAGAYPGAPCQTCPQKVGVNYAPYTAYRNQVIQVPTTVYRPVTGIDPRTGVPVTVLQPCQITTQQVQRVPAPFSRSFARTYQPIPVTNKSAPPIAFAPVAVPAPTAVNMPTYVPLTAPTVGSWPNVQVAPAGAAYGSNSTVPYASSPYPTVPATGYFAPATGTVRPSVPANSGLSSPQSGDPADFAPSLNSSPSSNGPSSPRGNSGASFRPSFPKTPLGSSNNRGLADESRPNSSTSAAGEGSLKPVPPSGFPVRPIPTPDAEESRGLQDRTPSLIQTPDDRSAQRGSERSLTASNGAGSKAVQPTSVSSTRRWDDSGWRSVP